MMSNEIDSRRPLTADEAARYTEAFGADRRRWPVATDRAVVATVEQDRALKQERAEAVALDRLLDRARPTPDVARLASLTDRITRAAERTPHVVGGGGDVPSRVGAPASQSPPSRSSWRAPIDRRDFRRGLSAIAACLILGISIGRLGLADSAWYGLGDLTGLAVATADVDED